MNRLISIIIPVYNEADTVGRLLCNLEPFKNRCEILFVDSGSTDYTVEIIKKSFTVLKSPTKGRAAQMNYGAKMAKGTILFFLHADSIIHQNALGEIYGVLESGRKIGCFNIQFDSQSLLMQICGFMSNMRVRFRNIAFGDQGIFIDKEYFESLGGFKEMPLMEDYQLSMDAKRDKEKIGLAKSPIITSERRFLKNGRLKTVWRMQKLQRMYRKGVDIERIARLYK